MEKAQNLVLPICTPGRLKTDVSNPPRPLSRRGSYSSDDQLLGMKLVTTAIDSLRATLVFRNFGVWNATLAEYWLRRDTGRSGARGFPKFGRRLITLFGLGFEFDTN